MLKIYAELTIDNFVKNIATSPIDMAFHEVYLQETTFDFSKLNGYTTTLIDGKEVLVFDQEKYDAYLADLKRTEDAAKGEEKFKALQNQSVLLMASDEDAYVMRYMYGELDPKGHEYKKGDRFLYNDKFYKVLQNHISQADWTPDAASSLYVEISDPSVEWPEFKQPTGAHDAYMKDDKVTYNGKHYISTMDNNVYSPDDYPQGWQLVE